VGKALEKLRTNDVPTSKTARLNEKNKALDEELQRLKAATRGFRQGQQGDSKRASGPTPSLSVATPISRSGGSNLQT
jgi:hypothetical protein